MTTHPRSPSHIHLSCSGKESGKEARRFAVKELAFVVGGVVVEFTMDTKVLHHGSERECS